MNSSEKPIIRLVFDRGSILAEGASEANLQEKPPLKLKWDERVGGFRGIALHYRALVRHFHHNGLSFQDEAGNYPEMELSQASPKVPFDHQREALEAWTRGKRGTVELPTGSGKSQLAIMAMETVGRGTLVIVPTLDLVTQWCEVIQKAFGIEPGVIGGGSFEIAPITVCTYASAYRHVEKFGDQFCLVIFDECHHLAGEGYARIAEGLIAPYRLGLSATLERPDQRHRLLDGLIGPVVYRKSITALSGSTLAEYRVEKVYTELTPDEREAYKNARETYLAYVRELGVAPGGGTSFQRFIYTAGRTPEGRAALDAFFLQKQITYSASGKFSLCAQLLSRHREQRMLIFTNDNATAYEISRRFLLPLITHQTRVAERRDILARLKDNRWPAVVTSKVLNEGVDVPAASVAIILSGNASVREHVQRLGRILRRDGDKQAILYEVLTRQTTEEFTSERRRQHDAYR